MYLNFELDKEQGMTITKNNISSCISKETACKESLTITQDESTKIYEEILWIQKLEELHSHISSDILVDSSCALVSDSLQAVSFFSSAFFMLHIVPILSWHFQWSFYWHIFLFLVMVIPCSLSNSKFKYMKLELQNNV